MSRKSSLRDRLTITTDDGKIELTEQELSRACGGNTKENKLSVNAWVCPGSKIVSW